MATGDDLELGATNNSADHKTFLAVKASYAPGLHVTNTGTGSVSDPVEALRGEAGDDKGDKAVGVHGVTSKGIGVQGETNDGIGVHGEARGGAGVVGESRSDIGVIGKSNRWRGVEGTGLVGVSGNGKVLGVLGVDSSRSRGVGVWGISGAGTAIYGSSSAGVAGQFDGDVFINGDLTKTGAGSCVAVPFPDGSLRRLYSVESPESWFEDFGEAELVNGKAEVVIDKGFAAVVRGSYHVFVTPYGNSNGLYVSRRTRKGFTVREQNRGKSDLAFSYRVVAKRKDIAGPRLEKVKRPAEPSLPPAPKKKIRKKARKKTR